MEKFVLFNLKNYFNFSTCSPLVWYYRQWQMKKLNAKEGKKSERTENNESSLKNLIAVEITLLMIIMRCNLR